MRCLDDTINKCDLEVSASLVMMLQRHLIAQAHQANTTLTSSLRYYVMALIPEFYNAYSYIQCGRVSSGWTNTGRYALIESPQGIDSHTIDSSGNVLQLTFERTLFFESHSANLIHLIRTGGFEYGYTSDAEEYVRVLLAGQPDMGKDLLMHTFLHYYSIPDVSSGILRIIAHFEYSEMQPYSEIFVERGLQHSSARVVECAIRVIENWERPEFIKKLMELELRQLWLADYCDMVIESLKEIKDKVRDL